MRVMRITSMNKADAKEYILETCGEGWLPLVDRVYENLPAELTITQTYQKWAALRFDIEPENEEFEEFLSQIEELSLKTCEKCGVQGISYYINSWEHTRCEEHSEGGIHFD